MKKCLFFLALLTCWLQEARAGFIPITIASGFNIDGIANGVGNASASSSPIDVPNGYSLVAPDFQAIAGNAPPFYSLPANGTINSIMTTGLSFQLASYSGNNTLLLTETNLTGNLSFATNTSAADIYLLLTSINSIGSGGFEPFSAVVNFTDNTSQTFSSLVAKEWYYQDDYAINGVGRVHLTNNGFEGDDDYPGLNQLVMHLDPSNYNKTISGISFTAAPQQNGVGEAIAIFAVSVNTACSGAPTQATTLSSTNNACSGVSFALSLDQSYSSAGILYQWQTSPDGNTWTNVSSGGTSDTYTATQSSATYYRCIVTCGGSGLSSTSVSVQVGQNAPNQCYCIPQYTTGCNDWGILYDISSVMLAGENSTSINNSSSCSNDAYGDYTGSVAPVTLLPENDYTLNLTTDYPWDDPFATAWIDLNNDGIFSNTEQVGSTGTSTGASFNINIPASATGLHRLRIRIVFDLWNMAVTDACSDAGGYYNTGETEDYLINLLPPTGCSQPSNITPTTDANNTGMNISWYAVSPTGAIFLYAIDQSNTNEPDAASTIGTTTQNSVSVPNLIADQIYYIHLRQVCSPGDSSSWKKAAFSLSSLCQNPITTVTEGVTYTGSSDALPDLNLPANSCGGSDSYYNGLWFKYTAPISGTCTASACGTEYDSYLRVYHGDCSSLICDGVDDDNYDACGSSASNMDFTAIAGTTYYFALTHYSVGGGDYSFKLTSQTPLDIKLKSFEGNKEGAVNVLKWSTAKEDKGDRFELEKSHDGKNFTLLSHIKSNGYPGDYNYIDNAPVKGINFYRLKMVDAQRNYNYSKTISISNENSTVPSVYVYPNPLTDYVTINASGSGNGQIALYDLSGKMLLQISMNGNMTQLDLSKYASGAYLLKYTDATQSKAFKIYKK